jgi:hypothetical protein
VTVRYYVFADASKRPLVRIDGDPERLLAERLDADGWLELPSLLDIIYDPEDWATWDEIDRTEAEHIARDSGFDPSILDAARATRSDNPLGRRPLDDPILIEGLKLMLANAAAVEMPPGADQIQIEVDKSPRG